MRNYNSTLKTTYVEMTNTETNYDILAKVINKGENVFISGVGGCGKSYLLKQLYAHFKLMKVCVLCSTTGISAYNLGGITVHNFTKIVIPSDMPANIFEWTDKLIRKLQRRPKIAQKYRQTQLMFIDEISMMGSNYFDLMNYVCQQLRGNTKPFGGIQLVLGGDMMQLSPVKDDFPFESESWKLLKLRYYRLTKAWRFDHQRWVDLLHRARLGELTEQDKQDLQSRVGLKSETSIVLASKNDVVDRINQTQLRQIKTNGIIYRAADYIVVKDEDDVVISQTLATLPEECSRQFMADAQLELKPGAAVMLIANLDVDAGLTNGTRGVVQRMYINEAGAQVVLVQFEMGEQEIGPFEFPLEHQEKHYMRVMIPLKLAFATSIHKSQSLTLAAVEMDIGSDIFCEGQSYVALSRCKSLEGLYIKKLDVSKIKPNYKALRFERAFLNECVDLK